MSTTINPTQLSGASTPERRRGGNPLGNPGLNLAPRCGARTRKGCACRAPAMANGRCRMHGGRSTGPRTPEGKAARTAAHTTHGHRAAPKRKVLRANRTLVRRILLCVAAVRLGQYMPAEMMAGLARYPLAFLPPERPCEVVVPANAPRTPYTCLPPLRRASRARGGAGVGLAVSGRAAERAVAVAEAALQAPWREAVAFARGVRRGVLAEKRDVRAATRAAWAAKRGVRVAKSTGRGREENGESRTMRQNPVQLSRAVDAAAAGLAAAQPARGRNPGRILAGRVDWRRRHDWCCGAGGLSGGVAEFGCHLPAPSGIGCGSAVGRSPTRSFCRERQPAHRRKAGDPIGGSLSTVRNTLRRSHTKQPNLMFNQSPDRHTQSSLNMRGC